MDPITKFNQEKNTNIQLARTDNEFMQYSQDWFKKSVIYKYPYNFTWMGIPIIQYPQDIVAMQELIFNIKPDVIIETGIAHGGSLVFYASMLQLLGGGEVIGVDIEIRQHNRKRLEEHPMKKYISLIEGSSILPEVIEQISHLAEKYKNPLIILDSLHTHEHVLNELRSYSKLVKKGGYIVVFDTIIEHMPKNFYSDRPWNVGDNPKTAVHEFLKENDRFKIDKAIEDKLLITTCPDGFLYCIK